MGPCLNTNGCGSAGVSVLDQRSTYVRSTIRYVSLVSLVSRVRCPGHNQLGSENLVLSDPPTVTG